MCGKTRIYFFKRRVHRVEAYRTHRFFHSPKIAASGALYPRRRAFTARLAPAQAPHRCRRRRCQRHPHMPRHADSLAVPVYFTRVPMHEQPRGASAVSPAFPRNASCVPPTRLRRSRRFVGAHRRLPYRREDHRKFIRGRKAHKGTGGAAVMLLYRAGLCVCGSLYGQFIIKERPHRAEFIFCLRTCAAPFRAYFIALCRKTQKKPKIARICSRRHRLRCAGRH